MVIEERNDKLMYNLVIMDRLDGADILILTF